VRQLGVAVGHVRVGQRPGLVGELQEARPGGEQLHVVLQLLERELVQMALTVGGPAVSDEPRA
jgi:hypothetical protein